MRWIPPQPPGARARGERVRRRLRKRAASRTTLAEGSEQAPIGFVDELQHAFKQIGRHPAVGSLRYAHELNLPGLRSWSLARYPHLVFYVERNDDIDVWRVLHGQRDIPAWIQSPECG